MSIFSIFSKPSFQDDTERAVYDAVKANLVSGVGLLVPQDKEKAIAFTLSKFDDLWKGSIQMTEESGLRGNYTAGNVIRQRHASGENKTFFEEKFASGLTIEDIARWWNEPCVLHVLEQFIAATINFTIISSYKNAGVDLEKALAHIRQMMVIYEPIVGDAPPWSSKADLPPELKFRIEKWRDGLGAGRFEDLVKEAEARDISMNAIIREKIQAGEI